MEIKNKKWRLKTKNSEEWRLKTKKEWRLKTKYIEEWRLKKILMEINVTTSELTSTGALDRHF